MTQAAQLAQSVAPGVSLGFKNRLINGAMVIDQRNAGASVTPTTSGYGLDRWNMTLSVASKFSFQQSTTFPSGFKNSLLVTSLSAYSVGAAENFTIRQYIEGYNVADLNWGLANASSVTLSFWVQSSLTGTFGGALRNADASRSYPFSYTISSANTWTQISVTVPGDTTGTWQTGSSIGIQVVFSLGSGSTFSGTAGSWASANYTSATGATSVVGTNGATFYITGVQLEVGTAATNFEFRDYGRELILCQRYFEMSSDIGSVPGANGQVFFSNGGVTTGSILNTVQFTCNKRAAPTVTIYDGNTGTVNQITRATAGISSQSGQTASTQGVTTRGVQVYSASGNSHSGITFYWKAEAEL